MLDMVFFLLCEILELKKASSNSAAQRASWPNHPSQVLHGVPDSEGFGVALAFVVLATLSFVDYSMVCPFNKIDRWWAHRSALV